MCKAEGIGSGEGRLGARATNERVEFDGRRIPVSHQPVRQCSSVFACGFCKSAGHQLATYTQPEPASDEFVEHQTCLWGQLIPSR